MNAPFSPPGEDDGGRAARAARRLEMLSELAETGMEISQRIRAEVRALNAVETVEDLKIAPTSEALAIAHWRVARAVSHVLALQARLEDGPRAATPSKAEAEAERVKQAEAGAKTRRRLTHMLMKAGPAFSHMVEGYEQPRPGEFDGEPESDDWKADAAFFAAEAAAEKGPADILAAATPPHPALSPVKDGGEGSTDRPTMRDDGFEPDPP